MNDSQDQAPPWATALVKQQIVVGVFLLGAGVIGFVGGMLGRTAIPGCVKLLEEIGLQAPGMLELGLRVHLPLISLVLGVLGAALAIGVSFARNPVLSWILAPLLLIGMSGVCALSLVSSLTATQHVLYWLDFESPEPPEPGHTAEIAELVDEAFRVSLERGVGSFETPAGRTIHYMIYTGPGVEDPAPAALPAYPEARRHPGCLILPWGHPGLRSEIRFEAKVLFPTGLSGGVDPAAPDWDRTAQPPPWLEEAANMATTERDDWGLRVPEVIPLSGELGRYAYSLIVGRGRLDDYDTGERPETLRMDLMTRLGTQDAFSDRLYELRIHVYRDFAPHGGGHTLPASHTPIETFRTQVAR